MLSPLSGATAMMVVDGKNFYASCERLFNPAIENVPVVVLSSNDGCVVSRNDQARKLVPMGAALFQYENLLAKNNTALYSSNYELYGDMSRRFLGELQEFTPDVQRDSIDESFLEFAEQKNKSFDYLARAIREQVENNIGIRVGVGVGSNKTLAKLANKLAKKSTKAQGIVNLYKSEFTDIALQRTEIEDVWNIGSKYAPKLRSNEWNVKTAYDFKLKNYKQVRKNFTILGARALQELNGIKCYELEVTPPLKKSVRCSNTFGEPITSFYELQTAASCFLMTAFDKMRQEKLSARSVEVGVSTNRFDQSNFYGNSYTYRSAYPSDNLFELQQWTGICLEKIFRAGCDYKKAVVTLGGLIPREGISRRLYPELRVDPKREKLSEIVEQINSKYGKNTLRLATAQKGRWQSKAERLSARRTTRIEEIPRLF